jgi:CRP-like cAMP-binding protein
MTQASENRQRNAILRALSPADLASLQPHLQSVPLPFRHQMQAANRRIKTVCFIESGLGSAVAIGGGRRLQAEVAVIGREGMTGLPVVLGAERSPCEIFMQVEGSGQSIAADRLSEAINQSATMARCFMRYAHVFAVQASYTALANAQGKIEQRLARWLLMAQDRLGTDVLKLTHEFLGLMLGVRRAGVTVALQKLESKAVLHTGRGAVTVADRAGLEACANGLYGQPEAEFDRLFSGARRPHIHSASGLKYKGPLFGGPSPG